MADYQVRRWDAWHHHMALVMLGTLFLLKQKIQGRKQWPMLSFNNLVLQTHISFFCFLDCSTHSCIVNIEMRCHFLHCEVTWKS